jgi:hypothetical protein
MHIINDHVVVMVNYPNQSFIQFVWLINFSSNTSLSLAVCKTEGDFCFTGQVIVKCYIKQYNANQLQKNKLISIKMIVKHKHKKHEYF